jgi:hypothetical protein
MLTVCGLIAIASERAQRRGNGTRSLRSKILTTILQCQCVVVLPRRRRSRHFDASFVPDRPLPCLQTRTHACGAPAVRSLRKMRLGEQRIRRGPRNACC